MNQDVRPSEEHAAWTAIALIAALTSTGLVAAGFRIACSSLLPPIIGATALLAAAAFYRRLRPDARLASTCVALAQLVLFTMAAGPLSYLVAVLDRPLHDAQLARMDMALGLDWRAYLALVDAHPGVGRAMTFAYDTLMPQLAAALLVLGLSGRLRAQRILVWAAGISGTATILVSGLLPAAGYYVHLGLTPANFPHLSPSAAFVHMADFTGLRDGSDRLIDLRTLQGIITFPSFHAALAALYAWGFWQHPRARWAGVAFEALVIAATPIDGGHYFVDVIAGILVTAASIWAAGRIVDAWNDEPAVSAGPLIATAAA